MEAYALTDIGRVRTMNQDYIYSSPEKVGSLPNLFLVADGMGGHRAGGARPVLGAQPAMCRECVLTVTQSFVICSPGDKPRQGSLWRA